MRHIGQRGPKNPSADASSWQAAQPSWDIRASTAKSRISGQGVALRLKKLSAPAVPGRRRRRGVPPRGDARAGRRHRRPVGATTRPAGRRWRPRRTTANLLVCHRSSRKVVFAASRVIGREVAERLGGESAAHVVNYASKRARADEVVAFVERAGKRWRCRPMWRPPLRSGACSTSRSGAGPGSTRW